jgi:3-deoxy-D-manno-octulosonic-acid transferase
LILFRLSWRGFKAPLYWQRWSERFGNVTPHAGDNPVIWIHAVSVGETEATRPLVNALMQHYPNYTILITTMTPTGSERVKSLYGSTVEHCYLPYDVPFMVKCFF